MNLHQIPRSKYKLSKVLKTSSDIWGRVEDEAPKNIATKGKSALIGLVKIRADLNLNIQEWW